MPSEINVLASRTFNDVTVKVSSFQDLHANGDERGNKTWWLDMGDLCCHVNLRFETFEDALKCLMGFENVHVESE